MSRDEESEKSFASQDSNANLVLPDSTTELLEFKDDFGMKVGDDDIGKGYKLLRIIPL